MNRLDLDIHGVSVQVLASDPAILQPLALDFKYFVINVTKVPGIDFRLGESQSLAPSKQGESQSLAPSEQGESQSLAPSKQRAIPAIILELHRTQAPAAAAGRPLFQTSRYRVYQKNKVRMIDYGDASADYDYEAKKGSIYCENLTRLHELAYLAILSRSGEALDLAGMHRIHALGFEAGGEAGLLLLPSGGGKSTLALELLRRWEFGILSEDTPLLRGDRVLAFPLRLGLEPSMDLSDVPEDWIRPFVRKHYGPKKLVDLDFFSHKVREDIPLRWLLIGRRGAEPRIETASPLEALAALFEHMVVGVGIAQMSEYTLGFSPSTISKLGQIGFKRLASAVSLLRRSSLHRFVLGPDARANAEALKALTMKQQAPTLSGNGRSSP